MSVYTLSGFDEEGEPITLILDTNRSEAVIRNDFEETTFVVSAVIKATRRSGFHILKVGERVLSFRASVVSTAIHAMEDFNNNLLNHGASHLGHNEQLSTHTKNESEHPHTVDVTPPNFRQDIRGTQGIISLLSNDPGKHKSQALFWSGVVRLISLLLMVLGVVAATFIIFGAIVEPAYVEEKMMTIAIGIGVAVGATLHAAVLLMLASYVSARSTRT